MTAEVTGSVDDPGSTRVSVSRIQPTPEPEELAAIIAAVEMTWPRPVVANPHQEIPRWRFSGRWWSKPLPVRRDRP